MKEQIIDYFGEGLLHETYGSTEGGVVTNLRPHDQLRKVNCVGLPFLCAIPAGYAHLTLKIIREFLQA